MPILVKIDGLQGHGDATLAGYDDRNWFVADSFSFGLGRDPAPPGGKGGTRDINIGVAEFSEIFLTKQLDGVSPLLAQLAASGNSGGDARIVVVHTGGDRPEAVLEYALRRCFVSHWSTFVGEDEPPVEEVSLFFTKIAFATAGSSEVFGWDVPKAKAWTKHGLSPLESPHRGPT